MRKHSYVILLVVLSIAFLAGEDITINEVFYTTKTNTNETQWLELYNKSNSSIDLSGWKVSTSKDGSNAFTIPAGTVLDSKGFLVLAASDDVMSSLWGIVQGIIEYDDALFFEESGDNIHLFNSSNTEIDALWYGDGGEMGTSSSAQTVSFGMSLSRNPDGKDTDIPSTDFLERFPTPTRSNNFTGFSQSTWGKIKAIYSIKKKLLSS
jgi:hypothetical protein